MNDLSDFLTYKGKFYVPQSLTKTILREYHDTCGYCGQIYTQEIISKQLSWRQVTHNIHKCCRNCDIYQNFKSDTYKVAGLYTPLPVPDQPQQQIHIVFISQLPEDEGHTMVMICIDCFSKILQLVPLQESDACIVADK